jgi:glycosyltransferase involved in cell wall biosynthesis
VDSLNVFVYPPAHRFGMEALFTAAAEHIPAQAVTWQVAAVPGELPPPGDSKRGTALAHLYSLPDVYASFHNLTSARRAGLRVVTTAIYADPARFYRQGLPLAELETSGPEAELAARIRRATQSAERALQRAIYRASDVLVALSPMEASALERDFGISPERIVIAMCGVERRGVPVETGGAAAERFRARYPLPPDFVLCVGRIDANKNQLSLVRAARDTGLPLVLAGGSLAPPYLERCRREAGPQVHFLPSLDDGELASAYAAARVHALVSWLEVVGLVTLEAAVAGCNVVLSPAHGALDYVGDEAWTCDPGDVDSIRRAVLDAHRTPRRPELAARLRAAYTWDGHARAVREAYDRACALEPPREETMGGRAELEAALLSLSTLVPLLEQARAQLWEEKSALARTVDAYASGRVMRALDRLRHFLGR